jgi:hypothetical protein
MPPKLTRALISAEKADRYDHLRPLLTAMTDEFREAARKKPEAALNKRKVSIVNRLLSDILDLLDGEPQRQYLDLLDEDDLPQNSDVSLMLGQVMSAMGLFEKKYTHQDLNYKMVWTTGPDVPARSD